MLKNSITDDINIIVLIFCCCIVCKTVDKLAARISDDEKLPIDSVASLNEYKGCTEIKGNLIINIRGSGGSGLLIKVHIFP